MFAERLMDKINSTNIGYCPLLGRFATGSPEAHQKFAAGSSEADEKQGLGIGIHLWFITSLPQVRQGFASGSPKNKANYLSFG